MAVVKKTKPCCPQPSSSNYEGGQEGQADTNLKKYSTMRTIKQNSLRLCVPLVDSNRITKKSWNSPRSLRLVSAHRQLTELTRFSVSLKFLNRTCVTKPITMLDVLSTIVTLPASSTLEGQRFFFCLRMI